MVPLGLVAAWGSVLRAVGGVRHPFLSPVNDQLADVCTFLVRSRDGLYEPALADSEREAVGDLLQYLENVRDDALLQQGGI